MLFKDSQHFIEDILVYKLLKCTACSQSEFWISTVMNIFIESNFKLIIFLKYTL